MLCFKRSKPPLSHIHPSLLARPAEPHGERRNILLPLLCYVFIGPLARRERWLNRERGKRRRRRITRRDRREGRSGRKSWHGRRG